MWSTLTPAGAALCAAMGFSADKPVNCLAAMLAYGPIVSAPITASSFAEWDANKGWAQYTDCHHVADDKYGKIYSCRKP
jgi:hypothetical protein